MNIKVLSTEEYFDYDGSEYFKQIEIFFTYQGKKGYYANGSPSGGSPFFLKIGERSASWTPVPKSTSCSDFSNEDRDFLRDFYTKFEIEVPTKEDLVKPQVAV